MLRKICRVCEGEMSTNYTPDGVTPYCARCEGETEHDQVEMEPYCPDCGHAVEFCAKCGTGYFCSACTSLKSSKRIVWKRA
jgi:hypothetical protein